MAVRLLGGAGLAGDRVARDRGRRCPCPPTTTSVSIDLISLLTAGDMIRRCDGVNGARPPTRERGAAAPTRRRSRPRRRRTPSGSASPRCPGRSGRCRSSSPTTPRAAADARRPRPGSRCRSACRSRSVWIHASSPVAPSFSASVIAPTLDEYLRICATLNVSVPRFSASWITRSATWIEYGQRERRLRRDEALGEHAGDGHELERRARLVRVGDGAVALQVAASCSSALFASKPGACAIASTSPVSRVEHDRRRGLRAPVRDRLAQHRLGLRLDRVVDRREEVGALLLGQRLDHVDRLAAAVAHDRAAARAGPRACGCTAPRARSGPCCRRPRSRSPARRPCPAGTSAAPRDRSRGRRCRASAACSASAGSANRCT